MKIIYLYVLIYTYILQHGSIVSISMNELIKLLRH